MNDRDLIRLAGDVLTADEFRVWLLKHYLEKPDGSHYGRRTGADELRITEDRWRTLIRKANIKVQQARKEVA